MSDFFQEDEALGRSYDGRLMRRFLGYVRPYRPLVAGTFALLVVRVGAELAGPLILKKAIDGPLAQGDYPALALYAALFFAAAAGTGLFEFLYSWTTKYVGQKIILDLRMKLFTHLQRLSLSFFDRNPVGRLIVRITNDVENLNELFTSGLVAFFSDIFLLAGVIAMMFLLNVKLALVTLATAPVIFALTMVFRTKARDRYREMRRHIARLNSYLNESIQGMRTVQMFGRERACAGSASGSPGSRRARECRRAAERRPMFSRLPRRLRLQADHW